MDQPTTAEHHPSPADLAGTVRPIRPSVADVDAPAAQVITDDVDDILIALGEPGPGEADAGIAVQVQLLSTSRQRSLFAALMRGRVAYVIVPSGGKTHGQTLTVRFRHRAELKVTFAAAAVADLDARGLWLVDKDLLP
ncbi:hypothetical protein G7075_04465 [Phycicoccus sp. HDW14]|uniref:hypothetical protein n=1 Tax=Phycicoccus sp. HDW14 TaxID=2714941 RepID=UPI00140ACC38|nr:hypothetical protein [Phycicoccus sp. HDW14]QIM19908.1 hypothetical protein G7075_00155 [Phycicoccus sp. HDW14]QIM20571.1 hypothetical protein G7075_04465 [Phycicoccus sp. HDW14]